MEAWSCLYLAWVLAMWVCTRCILRKWGFSSEDILEPGLRAACLSKAESGRGRQQRAGQRRCCVNCKVLLLLLASRGRSSLWNHTQWPSFFLSQFFSHFLSCCRIIIVLFNLQFSFFDTAGIWYENTAENMLKASFRLHRLETSSIFCYDSMK